MLCGSALMILTLSFCGAEENVFSFFFVCFLPQAIFQSGIGKTLKLDITLNIKLKSVPLLSDKSGATEDIKPCQHQMAAFDFLFFSFIPSEQMLSFQTNAPVKITSLSSPSSITHIPDSCAYVSLTLKTIYSYAIKIG